MTAWPPRRCAALCFGILGAALLVGCQQNEDISHYQVPREPVASTPTYKVPDDWKKIPDEMALAAYRVGDGDQTAKISVTTLSGEAGGTLANVNRWRGQLHLPPYNLAQLDAELNKPEAKFDVGGLTVKFVDISGKTVEKGGDQPTLKDDRILGMILPYNGQTWFFKMRGPPLVVGIHFSEFVEFVRSVRFDGGNHE